ncbi:MAG TPA: ABC transporter permease [Vicinamibacterales bacterium]|nr:ABC transporter permease [Vicinamibacterales bacterium]
MRELIRRVTHLFRRRQFDADLAEEMAFHRAMTERALEDAGVERRDAALETRRRFGSAALAADRARDVWIPAWLQDAGLDLLFAARRLTADLRFTAAAVLGLGLGIGANVMVFTFINAILFREVPFERSEQLAWVQSRDSRGRTAGLSFAAFQDYRASARTFEGLAATMGSPLNLSDEDRAPERVQGCYVSANAFRLLRTRPILGRDFLPEDDRPGAPPVIIIGHDLWVSRYGGEASALGSAIRVNGAPATIVGVMPVDFRFPLIAAAWQPIAQAPGIAAAARDARTLNPFGRLSDGVALDAAIQELNTVAARLAGEFPATDKGISFEALLMNKRGAGAISVLYTLMGAVAFVLLIACANVANLLLARAAHRAREIAIRSSLGATRWRIVRQLLIESLVVAIAAGGAGYAFSVAGVRLFAVIFAVRELGGSTATMPYWLNLSADGRVFAFLAGVCLVSTVLFGLAPALHVSKTNINEVLKDGGKGVAGQMRSRRWTGALLVAELALTLILLAGTGLLVRSFVAMYRAVARVESRDVVTARVALPLQKYATPAARLAFFDQLGDRVTANAGVGAFAIASEPPFMPVPGAPRELTLEGRVPVPGETPAAVSYVFVTPRFFDVVGQPLLRGRIFTDADGTPGQTVAIVNQRFASMHFPDADAVGRRLRLTAPGPAGRDAPWLTIVGVVGSQATLSADTQPPPIVYTPLRAETAGGRVAALLVRGRAGTAATTALLRDEVRRLDGDLPLYFVQTVGDIVGQNVYSLRVFGEMVGLFAFIALVLAAVGLYAVTAHSVVERTNEVGIRMALGAHTSEVAWMFLRRTLVQLAIGLPLGLAGALATGQLLRRFLVNTPARDPLTLAVVALLLTGIALVACLLPARRAARIDPVVALRYE